MTESRPWNVESLRLTVFSPRFSAPFSSLSESWRQACGVEPDETGSKKEGPSAFAQGNLGKFDVRLEFQLGRVDWLLVPHLESSAEIKFPSMGDWISATGTLRKLTTGWLISQGDLTRIAFGAVLNFPTDDRPTSYRHLQAFLRDVRLDAENSSDFTYTINRPRPSVSLRGKGTINRLSKWAAAQLSVLRATPDSKGGSLMLADAATAFASRLELDVNTAPLADFAIGSHVVASVLEELIALGEEISVQGDVP